MRKTLLTGALAALVAAAPAGADGTSNPNSPSQQCRAERSAMGEANFRTTYGTNANRSNAFGNCVSRHAQAGRNDADSAAKRCRAEQADANFAAAHDGKTFAQFYGTNRNDRNAFGKCVSAKAKAATAERQRARLEAARDCRAEQRKDPAAFRAKYGTNRNKSNAFGKCVSRQARQA